MTREEIAEIAESNYVECILMDGYDNAIVGYTLDGDTMRAVYSHQLCVQCLMDDDGMTYEDAEDYFQYNTIRSLPYLGDKAPMVIETEA